MRLIAWSALAVTVAATAAALVSPWPVPVGLAAAALLLIDRRLGFLTFALLTIAINAILLGFLMPAGVRPLPVPFGLDGAWAGLVGGVRMAGAVGVNLALLAQYPMARLVDDLHLPRRWTAWMAAVLVAAHDIGRDAATLFDVAGKGRWRRVQAAVLRLPAILVIAHRRARIRREALWLVGVRTSRSFAPIVAVTALAVAGRLALVAVPNVALTYVLVFLGGVVYGPRVGATAGLLAMVLTDLMLSGLVPLAFVNAPAMALVGAAGGGMRGLDMDSGRGARILVASTGILATFGFSIAADVLAWALVPEFRASVSLLQVRVLAGLAFNVLPAISNAILFALAVGPVQQAFRPLRP